MGLDTVSILQRVRRLQTFVFRERETISHGQIAEEQLLVSEM